MLNVFTLFSSSLYVRTLYTYIVRVMYTRSYSINVQYHVCSAVFVRHSQQLVYYSALEPFPLLPALTIRIL